MSLSNTDFPEYFITQKLFVDDRLVYISTIADELLLFDRFNVNVLKRF